MRYSVITSMLLIMLCTSVFGEPNGPDAEGRGASTQPHGLKKEYQLPKDPKAVVIRLNYRGGRRRVVKDESTLSILANGTVLVPDKYGNSQDVQSKISQRELQELLHFIIGKNKFLEYDKKLVEGEKKRVLRPIPGNPNKIVRAPRVMDASTTVIYIHAEGKEREVSEYALSIYLRGQYKDIVELQQLYAIQKRLSDVLTIAHGGGMKKVNQMTRLVNKNLKKKYPAAKPLTLEHLRNVSTMSDGSKKYSYQRTKPGPPGNGQQGATYTMVTVKQPTKGEIEFSIQAKLK